MQTRIDPAQGRQSLRTTERLPRHDLYYGSPQLGPEAGIPIGDGVTGTLLWLEEDAIRFQLNRADLWEDAPPRRKGGHLQPAPYGCNLNVPEGTLEDDRCFNASGEEELTCQKHAGEVVIRFSEPLLHRTYQKEFTARLSLGKAEATLESVTPFSHLQVSAIACASEEVTAIRVHLVSEDGDAPEITLARWGTRTFWRWYCTQRFLPEKGLDGTEALAEDGRIFVTQTLNAASFCIGLSVSGTPVKATVRNRRSAALITERAEEVSFTIFLAVRTGETKAAKEACLAALKRAEAAGYNGLLTRHTVDWETFWNVSYVAFPDDYLENLWYLWLYLMNSSCHGAYPPHFTAGLWSFQRDFVPWNYYFHYNLQHLFAPLDAAGHGSLQKCYFDLRKSGIPTAHLYAQTVKGLKGIFLHDVTDRYGRGANYDACNCSCAAQAAMQMYRHWRYTGDDAFLREFALPMMRGAAEFYLDLLTPGDDGLLHLSGTTAYEGNAPTEDTLTDLVMIRTLFSALAPLEHKDTRHLLEDAISRLPGPILLPLESTDDGVGERFCFGVGKGRTPYGDRKVFGVGYRDGIPVRNSYGNPSSEKLRYGFPDIELCPLYPAGIFGLKEKGTPLFDAMENQIALHCPGDACGHWNLLPIYLARMGMAREVIEHGRGMVSANQGFPNGFNGETSERGNPRNPGPAWYRVRDAETGECGLQRPEEFVHFDFETVPILAQAVTDSLLQSHEGVLRPFAAVLPGDAAAFSLAAEGGFVLCGEVTAEGWVLIVESFRGEPCRLSLPSWAEKVYAYRMGETGPIPDSCPGLTEGQAGAMQLPLRAGERMLLAVCPVEKLRFCPEGRSAHNCAMKWCGNARLGTPPLR